jgi:hypothetical protein
MGLLDNIAKRVADQLAKSPNLPVGAIAMTETQMRNSGNNTNYGFTDALPRNPITPTVPFSPGMPIIPGAINPANLETGRPAPRRYEYQVAQNINITETRLTPFKTLRAAADQIDILRRCIEVLKAKVSSLDWDIVLAEDSVEKIIAEIGGNQVRAAGIARERFNEEISRAREFWEQPDKANGLGFTDWLSLALEEILVLDAWAVWPQETVGGELYGLQILDGSTIKPLIDDRGMRPAAPNPAYQQILYGFPRSEFSAPTEGEDADGEFTSDELSYMVRNRRTTSVYGYGPTERALPLADIYLRRQQWIRSEYTDGVTPELMMTTDANFGNNPDLLRAYENIFNNDLSGQTEQRKRVRLLPQGLTPIQFDGYGEKFKDTLDDYLVNSICGHFGVMPSEIGFTPKSGLGGAGHQIGEAQSSEVIGAIPMANWIGRMITNLSYNYLGMPRELEFKFMPSGRQDSETLARTHDIEVRNGGITVNEMRSIAGRSLIDSVEADMPIIVTGTSAYFLTDEGIKSFDEGLVTPDVSIDAEETPAIETAPEELDAVKAQKEISKFIRWIHNSPEKEIRKFNFEHVPTVYAEVLNKFVAVKDFESAFWYAERYLA